MTLNSLRLRKEPHLGLVYENCSNFPYCYIISLGVSPPKEEGDNCGEYAENPHIAMKKRSVFYATSILLLGLVVSYTIYVRKKPTHLDHALVEAVARSCTFDECGERLAVDPNAAPRVRLLLKQGADVNARDEDGKTVLMYACDYGLIDIARMLLEYGANVNAKDKYGGTALMEGCYDNEIDIVRLLLEYGANVNAKDKYGVTALMHARFLEIDTVRLLLEYGANVNAKDKNNGETALMKICQGPSKIDLARMLLEYGADVNAKDKDGVTALMNECDYDKIDIVRMLLENGADIDAKDKDGDTALMMAIYYSFDIDAVQILLENGANVNARNYNGLTPLMFAVTPNEIWVDEAVTPNLIEVEIEVDEDNWHNLVALLVQNGADVNATDNDGLTPLIYVLQHFPCDYERMKRDDWDYVPRFLVNHGADVNLMTNDGCRALDYNIGDEFEEFLINEGAIPGEAEDWYCGTWVC